MALAVNPGSPAGVLIALLEDVHWSVRLSIVDNPAAAGLAVRVAMCGAAHEDVRLVLAQWRGLHDEVVARLTQDPSRAVREALAELTDNPAALEALLADPEPRVRGKAGMNPHTTAQQRRRLVHDPSRGVRSSVAWSKSVHGWEIPEDDLLTLARDRSVNVRYWLANLPGATREVYQILAQDADEMVATTAGLWLLPPDDPRYPENHGGQIQSDLAELLGADLFVQGDFSDPRYLGRPIPHVAPSACDGLSRRVVEMSAK